MKKQWNKDIRDQLKDFPQKAPEGLLEDIKAEMLRRGLPSVPTTGKHPAVRSKLILRVASIAALIAILWGISGLMEKLMPPADVEEMVSSSIVNPTIAEPMIESPESAALEQTPSSFIAMVEKVKPVVRQDVSLAEADEPHVTEYEDEGQQESDGEELKQKNVASQEKTEYIPTSPGAKLPYQASRQKRSSWAVGVYYSGMVAQFNPEGNGDFMSASPPPPPYEDLSPVGQNVAVASRRADVPFKLVSQTTHRLPVKLGVSVRYQLDERWNLQSGLTYSYLSSELYDTQQDKTYNTEQKLHYLGVPLQLGYQVWAGKRFRGYMVAGGQVEKLVSGKASIIYSQDNMVMSTPEQDVSDHRLLFSATASVGIEYALGKDLSLYAEPGVQYYFKNGNGLRTYYNEQPLNLSMTVGFRFHWKK